MKVRHISGQGREFPVVTSYVGEQDWFIYDQDTKRNYSLPKSEYVEVHEPPTWRDVTEECSDMGGGIRIEAEKYWHCLPTGYRLRKVRLGKYPDYDMRHPNFVWQDVFIVERKES